jgi:hypothetical protein
MILSRQARDKREQNPEIEGRVTQRQHGGGDGQVYGLDLGRTASTAGHSARGWTLGRYSGRTACEGMGRCRGGRWDAAAVSAPPRGSGYEAVA